MVSGLLASGWPVPLLWEVIARPLPELRRTVGAVISGRLKAAAATPVPGSAAGTPAVPHQAPGPDRTAPGEGAAAGKTGRRPPRPPEPTWNSTTSRSGAASTATPVCEADDGRCPTLAVVGETRCAEHLGWPLCPGHDGHPCTARTRTGDQCATCQDQARYAHLDAELPVSRDRRRHLSRPQWPLRPGRHAR